MIQEKYFDYLRQASLQELQAIVINDLSCPIDWSVEKVGSAAQIFLQKWFYIVSDFMPNGEMDVSGLRTWRGEYLQAPNTESLEDRHFDYEDVLSLAFNTYRFREEYRELYRATCEKFTGLRAQSALERAKHYAVGAKTLIEVIANSKKAPGIGKLLPNFGPEPQREFFWETVSDAFDRERWNYEQSLEEEDSSLYDFERATFDKAWSSLFGFDHYRLAVNTMTTIGYSSGNPADWLIYDVSFHGKIIHCYPVLEPTDGLRQIALDNLQGVEEAFIEGRIDWP